MSRLTVQEAIDQLDQLDTDTEAAHAQADEILLGAVHPDVASAYDRLVDRQGSWWYA